MILLERAGTRIVVADQSEARFYDLGPGGTLQIAGRLVNANARLHDRDLVSDRPGRVFNRAPPATGRRGAGAHHATDGERSPHRHQARLFARRVGAELDRGRRRNRFERLVLVAGPPFLGMLREALPRSLRKLMVSEVAKDLVHRPERIVKTHLAQALSEDTLQEHTST